VTRLPHLLFALVLVQAAPAFTTCAPIPGADQIWSNASLRWVFIGELHGSNEAPVAFGDLVCDALAHGKHVTVALERPSSEQAALDRILGSKTLPDAKSALLRQPGWRQHWDGRSSEAMLRLLFSLRELHAHNPELSVFAFDAPYTGTNAGARDAALGNALLSLGRAKPHDQILILVGNAHAMKAPQFGFNPAAMYLPASQTLSLEVTDKGGESWNLMDGACGAFKGGIREKGAPNPRGIFLDPSAAPFGKVDGVLSLGVPLTASDPADGGIKPLPPCRVKFLSQHANH
jgi:hypothetical protein